MTIFLLIVVIVLQLNWLHILTRQKKKMDQVIAGNTAILASITKLSSDIQTKLATLAASTVSASVVQSLLDQQNAISSAVSNLDAMVNAPTDLTTPAA